MTTVDRGSAPTLTPHFEPAALVARVSEDQCGFLTESDVALLAGHPSSRLTQVLVRCGGCRFVCAAQDVRHLIALVESGSDNGRVGDYVRDVSLLAVTR